MYARLIDGISILKNGTVQGFTVLMSQWFDLIMCDVLLDAWCSWRMIIPSDVRLIFLLFFFFFFFFGLSVDAN